MIRSAVTSLTLSLGILVATSGTAAQEVGSATVVPIQVTGDPAKRFSMVVLGDGYTAAEMPKFRAHLDKHLNVLWSIEPFRSYRNYINVYAVEIVSGESGITCDPEVRQQRNTPLGMQFGGGCTNINARGITIPQEKQALTRQYAAKATPHFDQILVIANTDTYGGIGGSLATTSGGNSLGPLITPHELGHSLGRLGDEYTYSARGKPGGAYTGGEPNSPHMTLMSIEDMLTKQAKWYRWMGEPSESGGKIERFEGGSSRTTGVWRPSKHSMMISVGYYFDQVSREQMTRRISAQVELIADSTPTGESLFQDSLISIETAHPVYHELTTTWTVNGQVVPGANNSPFLDLGKLKLPAPATDVTVTVVDPTPFVRDPEIRKTALTATRSWKVGPTSRLGGIVASPIAITASTETGRRVGGTDVVYLETSSPSNRPMPDIGWRLDGNVVASAANRRTFPLAVQKLVPGTHTLAATTTGLPTQTWTIDNTQPSVVHTLSPAVASIPGVDADRHYFMRDEFTMKLDATDDQPGYVVAEFRVNGDGWHHYYGWPDAPPGTPYKFTPRGTTIKELVYGSLSSEGLSPQPWEPREPGWGTHRIEYRGIDAAGNIGAANAFRVTFMPSPVCTATITGQHAGPLAVTTGTTCLDAATVTGSVTVSAGASLVAVSSTIAALTTTGAENVELVNTTVKGAMRITGTTGALTLFGSTLGADTTISGNKTAKPILLAGNVVSGALACTGNSALPVDGGTPNSLKKPAMGQCAGR
jgi:IgA Peptidase M64